MLVLVHQFRTPTAQPINLNGSVIWRNRSIREVWRTIIAARGDTRLVGLSPLGEPDQG
jgi:hypothetical protein